MVSRGNRQEGGRQVGDKLQGGRGAGGKRVSGGEPQEGAGRKQAGAKLWVGGKLQAGGGKGVNSRRGREASNCFRAPKLLQNYSGPQRLGIFLIGVIQDKLILGQFGLPRIQTESIFIGLHTPNPDSNWEHTMTGGSIP